MVLVEKLKKIHIRRPLVLLGGLWKFLNSPLFLLVATLIIGQYLIPRVLADYQSMRQRQTMVVEDAQLHSEALLNLSYRKLFLAKNFYWNSFEPGFAIKKDALWVDYYKTVIDYNQQLVPDFMFLEHYYNHDIREYFENEVHRNQNKLHNELLKVKNGEPYNKEDINNLLHIMDDRMYNLAEKLTNIEN